MAASSGAVTAWMWRRCWSRTMRCCCCCCCCRRRRRRRKLQKEQASAGVFAPKFAGETPTGRAARAGAGPASDKAAKHPPHTSAQGRVPAHQRSRASNVDAVDDICGSGSKAERRPNQSTVGVHHNHQNSTVGLHQLCKSPTCIASTSTVMPRSRGGNAATIAHHLALSVKVLRTRLSAKEEFSRPRA